MIGRAESHTGPVDTPLVDLREQVYCQPFHIK
jgi:hypothetical protein